MKLNIHKKVLLLVLGAGLAAFIALLVVSYVGYGVAKNEIRNMSVELGEKSASYTTELLLEQLKYTFGELAEARAQFIDREMSIMREDAEILADTMTKIFSQPENFQPKTLPDPRNGPVKMGEPYIIYAPDLRNNLTPKIQNDIAIAANIREILFEILITYEDNNATAFVASEDGWHICGRLVVNENGKVDFNQMVTLSNERIYEFDPRLRPWFIAAQNAGAPVISNLYRTIETEGNHSYLQIGASAPFYDAAGNIIGVAGVDVSNNDLYDWVNDVNQNSGLANFVLNDDGEILFSSQTEGIFAVKKSDTDLVSRKDSNDLRKSSNQSLAAAAEKMVKGEEGTVLVDIGGENFYLAFAPMEETGWSYAMIISEEEVLKNSENTREYFLEQVASLQNKIGNEYSYVNNIVVMVLAFLLITLFLMSTYLSRRFVRPIHDLSDGVREISSGNLDKKLDILTEDEIGHLAKSFNAMTDDLKGYMANLTKVTAEKERIATELDVAAEIQSGMLPKDFPTRDDFELFATMTPAKEVGGDFYDFYMLDETHLAITVADVSGKGIPAALFMVITKTVLQNFAASFYRQNGLANVVAAANEKLCAQNEAMMFVTAFVGVLDLETGEFVYVNAGHNPPVLYRAAENHCEFLDVKKNFVLGPMDGIPFVEQHVTFKRGDLLFLYTDGVTEALNTSDEEYLPERLINFMNSTDCRVDLHELLKNVRGDVADHVGEAEQSDDITMFALRFVGRARDGD
ncbi:MAG: SpoIIE family protein phosphatase [Quinella sp. 2Q5]|nr:SpoIIE family protein phosphatase [Quinella sp. 2Q5]